MTLPRHRTNTRLPWGLRWIRSADGAFNAAVGGAHLSLIGENNLYTVTVKHSKHKGQFRQTFHKVEYAKKNASKLLAIAYIYWELMALREEGPEVFPFLAERRTALTVVLGVLVSNVDILIDNESLIEKLRNESIV